MVYIKLFATLEEPKTVTALMVLAYILSIGSGVLLIASSIAYPGLIFEPLAIVSGIVMILSGAFGAPVAWTGKYWLERAAAVGFSFGAALLCLTLTLAFWVNQTIFSFGLDAWLSLLWASNAIILGVIRFERCRLIPYAIGKGPLLPEHRKTLAIKKMQEDWEKVINKEG